MKKEFDMEEEFDIGIEFDIEKELFDFENEFDMENEPTTNNEWSNGLPNVTLNSLSSKLNLAQSMASPIPPGLELLILFD